MTSEVARGTEQAPAGASSGLAVLQQPDAARSQSEEAYLRIRERIVNLDLPPGSVVHEGRLREDLAIGRTPIREALQRLAHENLVRSVPHRGTFVTDVNITDLARITEVRLVLEAEAARLAAERATAADRQAIEEIMTVLEAGGATDQRGLMRLDQEIHRRVYHAARNSFLEATLERYFNLEPTALVPGPRPRGAAARGGRRAHRAAARGAQRRRRQRGVDHAPPRERLRARDTESSGGGIRAMPKIFFATDLHGSEMCWRKFINAARFYDCDVLVCGGDMTGKAIDPDRRGGRRPLQRDLGGRAPGRRH